MAAPRPKCQMRPQDCREAIPIPTLLFNYVWANHSQLGPQTPEPSTFLSKGPSRHDVDPCFPKTHQFYGRVGAWLLADCSGRSHRPTPKWWPCPWGMPDICRDVEIDSTAQCVFQPEQGKQLGRGGEGKLEMARRKRRAGEGQNKKEKKKSQLCSYYT